MEGLKFVGGWTIVLLRRWAPSSAMPLPPPRETRISPGFKTTRPDQNERNLPLRSVDFQSAVTEFDLA